MAKITVNDLLAAGVHFGHQTKRWNPKMQDYVYGVKNGIYIIDLAKTMHQLAGACNFLQQTVVNGGDILFVGTKRQAQNVVKEAAENTDMFYVTERWLGGTLTNNKTIKRSVTKMQEIDKLLDSDESKGMRKKELASLARTSAKLHRNLGGIWNMKKLPAALVIVDICHEHIAVAEAYKLGIPIVAIVDTNADPDKISHPVVANDDALKSISIIINIISSAVKTASELYQKKVVEEAAAAEKARIEAEKEAAAKKEKEKAEKDAAKKAEAKPKKPAAKKSDEKKEASEKPEKKEDKKEKAEPKSEKKDEKPKAKSKAKADEKKEDKTAEKKEKEDKKEDK
jgi:small subunit ribosomal protein S2